MYTVEKGSIRIGLGAIKGVTPTFYDAIKACKESLVAIGRQCLILQHALGGDVFTEKAISPLIKAGALDEFGESRAVLLASIDAAISHALFIRPDDGDDLLSAVFRSIASPNILRVVQCRA